ncbi:hypothetical protein [Mycolicibacter arupensis]|jgi:hypothetical protein|uniref:Minor tail protein n=1 Tax=Mycolicibacter arupensis TaxID=342002 RepID=A0A0F5MVW2_9MYCO|nr:hypothetical protein [Mycolicibacter arupensis]KKB98826.1 hypothetical protein WR43_12505 [Mycolicibacter arupensis]MCV7277097.1 hypothetical protein [Mycolicibacter arupensis]OQZ93674.1 hypothetical protein BST15_17535 [Mycolicibacter arupensis]TXI54435.1 MAG: hypothetical protein E6Q54_14630 [Mycolicibacter arupensis]
MSQYLTLDIIGRDGSFWRVMGPGRGQQHVILSPKSAMIFDLPTETRWVKNALGQRYQSYEFQKRTFVLTFLAYHCDKYTWSDIVTRFGWAFDYDTETILRFTGPDGVRDMYVRKEHHSTAFSAMPWEAREPFLTGTSSEQFTLSAELPFYVGKPKRQQWSTNNITGWHAFDFTNESSVPVWPRWTLSDQADWDIPDCSWGSPILGRPDEDMGRTVPIEIDPRDQGAVADSDPRAQTLLSPNDTPIQARWRGYDLRYPIPAGVSGGKATVWVRNNYNTDGAHCRLTIPQWYDRPMSRPLVLAR